MALGDNGKVITEADYQADLSYLLVSGAFVEHMANKYPHATIAVRMSLQDCGEMVRILKETKRK